MPHSFQVRTGQAGDADRLAVLAAQVWLHTYATDGISNEIAQYVLSELTVEKFSEHLNEPQITILVAERDHYLAGFAVLKFGAACPSDAGVRVELQTLYVQAHFVGHGIGWALLQAAQGKAQEQSSSPLWLTVNSKNARALAFYARQGYTKVGITYFVLGDGRHENHVLVGGGAH